MKTFVFAALLAVGLTAQANKPMPLDTATSSLKWTGSKITKDSHWGTVALKEGSVTFTKDIPTAGSFVIDMTSIKCDDLTDAKMNGRLVGHLKSDDFFSVDKHPTATFKITKATAGKNGEVTITGDLTIKGITKPITFPATVKNEGGVYAASGKLKFNRTDWDVKYNSGKFFDPKKLGDKLINDDIEIEINLRTAKS